MIKYCFVDERPYKCSEHRKSKFVGSDRRASRYVTLELNDRNAGKKATKEVG